jgi:hypothetical protein
MSKAKALARKISAMLVSKRDYEFKVVEDFSEIDKDKDKDKDKEKDIIYFYIGEPTREQKAEGN